MIDDSRAGQLLVWGDLPSGRFRFVMPPDTSTHDLARRLTIALREAVASVGGDVTWTLREPEVELHSSIIESEAQAMARREREERERVAAYAAGSERLALGDGIVRIKVPPNGYRYERDGRPWVMSNRCRRCHEIGMFADTERCADCEREIRENVNGN